MAYIKQVWTPHVTPLDAAHMSHIEDGIAAVDAKPPPVIPTADRCTLTRGATFALPGGAWTKIPLTNPIVDHGGLFSVDKIVIKKAGDYLVTCHTSVDGSGKPAGSSFQTSIQRNGAGFTGPGVRDMIPAGLNGSGADHAVIWSFNANDVLELYVYASTAVNLSGGQLSAMQVL